jgi:elongation factor 3
LKKEDKESFSLNTMTEFQAELREIGDVISLENIKKFEGLLENMKSADFEVRNTTMKVLSGIVSKYDGENSKWMEPYFLKFLPVLMDNIASPKTCAIAKETSMEIIRTMNIYSLRVVRDLLFSSLDSMKWQTKCGALTVMGMFKRLEKEVVKQNLPSLILRLIGMASDVKKEVTLQTRVCFEDLCSVIDNVDIVPIIPVVIDAYMEPVKCTEKALDKLVSTSFINEVDLSTLGLLVPILIKGMREKKVAAKRRSALVIGNMCKLVNDPRTAAEFYPILKPVLERGIDEIAIEEVRNVCQTSLDTLQRVSSEAKEISKEVMTVDELADYINQRIPSDKVALMKDIVAHTTWCCNINLEANTRSEEAWAACIKPYLRSVFSSDETYNEFFKDVYEKGIQNLTPDKVDPEDEEEDLCNAQFSLAYGTRVLLHQTPFRVKIGRKYGLVGPNGAGKSTLMKSIAGGNLQGFPTHLVTVYVECEIIGEKADMSVIDYIMSDEKVKSRNCTEEDVRAMLTDMGFGVSRTAAAIEAGVSTLSGGWRMKLALSRAMLLNPDMLLLDEPTNHLDQFAIKWLTDYIIQLKTCTCLIVSHDTKFLDAVCTNIIHYENLKLKSYRGNLSDFVKMKPEARAYYELSSDIVAFSFPDPGPLDGVKSLTKAVLKTKNVFFQYPTAPQPQLIDVSIQCSLASRVAVVGVNGAGKSTLVKLMVGELEPDQGIIEKHPNLRVAYVAQHAFAHIEDHLEKTPIEYVMWRYRGGYDKEAVKKDSIIMSEEEIKAVRAKAKEEKSGIVEEIKGRRTGKREFEYEVIWEGDGREDSWMLRTELLKMGYKKMLDEKDEQIAMESMLGQRKLTTGEIQRHFDGFGLEPAFAQHTRMGALSGGQKVKVVLGAGLWNLPHIVILDEPTNFLDRDSLGALASAIKEFKGGLFMISHNAEFYEALCPEKWILESGRLTVMGAEWMEEVEKARKKAEKLAKRSLNLDKHNSEETKDALGNTIAPTASQEPRELSRAERKKLMKQRKDMIKNGEDTYDIDILLGKE